MYGTWESPKLPRFFLGKYASPIEHLEYVTPPNKKSGDRG